MTEHERPRRRFTPEEVEATFSVPPEEIRQWLEEMAAAQRPAVERAIRQLTGKDSSIDS